MKQKKLQNLRRIYERAQEGIPAPDKLSRTQRIAHSLGKKTIERINKSNAPLEAHKQAEFDQATELAQGANKLALAIVRETARIPHQDQMVPTWGVHYSDGDGNNTIRWGTHLSSGPDQDPSRPDKMPLSTPLGELQIDSSEWTMNAFKVPVDNIVISVETPLDEAGNMGPSRTHLAINTRPYELQRKRMYESKTTRFTNSLRLAIAPDGTCEKVELEFTSGTGFVPMNPATMQIGLVPFLEGVQQAVSQTADLYSQL